MEIHFYGNFLGFGTPPGGVEIVSRDGRKMNPPTDISCLKVVNDVSFMGLKESDRGAPLASDFSYQSLTVISASGKHEQPGFCRPPGGAVVTVLKIVSSYPHHR